jgi:hypothetical protein
VNLKGIHLPTVAVALIGVVVAILIYHVVTHR